MLAVDKIWRRRQARVGGGVQLPSKSKIFGLSMIVYDYTFGQDTEAPSYMACGVPPLLTFVGLTLAPGTTDLTELDVGDGFYVKTRQDYITVRARYPGYTQYMPDLVFQSESVRPSKHKIDLVVPKSTSSFAMKLEKVSTYLESKGLVVVLTNCVTTVFECINSLTPFIAFDLPNVESEVMEPLKRFFYKFDVDANGNVVGFDSVGVTSVLEETDFSQLETSLSDSREIYKYILHHCCEKTIQVKRLEGPVYCSVKARQVLVKKVVINVVKALYPANNFVQVDRLLLGSNLRNTSNTPLVINEILYSISPGWKTHVDPVLLHIGPFVSRVKQVIDEFYTESTSAAVDYNFVFVENCSFFRNKKFPSPGWECKFRASPPVAYPGYFADCLKTCKRVVFTVLPYALEFKTLFPDFQGTVETCLPRIHEPLIPFSFTRPIRLATSVVGMSVPESGFVSEVVPLTNKVGGVVMIDGDDPELVPTIQYCILTRTPVLTTPTAVTEHLLGKDHPFFYNTLYQAQKLLDCSQEDFERAYDSSF